MVHLRINQKEANPNPHINFITPLPCEAGFSPSFEDAKELLRALAAQVRPIMKSHGYSVNSFEEYEFNKVFAGRNWNHGETIELVLRRPDGSLYGVDHLINVLCHELAHITYMHHLHDFQTLWARLRSEVYALQRDGYFGDGCWSSGNRLGDSAQIQGRGIGGAGEVVPEYICGGAHEQKRSSYLTSRRTRRPRGEIVPSNYTGAQTAKKRKAGTRISKALPGEGVTLSGEGGSFGKKAGSKRARDERAAAAERRLAALRDPTPGGSSSGPGEEEEPEDGDEEDDDSRRQVMHEVVSISELESIRTVPMGPVGSSFAGKPSNGLDKAQDNPLGNSKPSPGPSVKNLGSKSQKEQRAVKDHDATVPAEAQEGVHNYLPSVSRKKRKLGLALEEVSHRKRENLGLIGGRTLGTILSSNGSAGGPEKRLRDSREVSTRSVTPGEPVDQPSSTAHQSEPPESNLNSDYWVCTICTLENHVDCALCDACQTRRESGQ